MLKKLFFQLTALNIFIGLVQPFNQFIDSILTGRGLGIEALEAFALFLPIGSLMMALSCIFSVGTQVSCSHLMGSGKFEESTKLTQTSFLSSFVLSVVIAVTFIVFSSGIAVILGAGKEVPGQLNDTASYIRGYSFGIPALFLNAVMAVLLQIEGKKHLVILMSLLNLVINAAGDLLNIFIFKKGLFGMAAATSVSHITVFIVLLIYFLFFSKMFRFSLAHFDKSKLIDIIKNGTPSLTFYGSVVFRTAFFNMLIITRLDRIVLSVMPVVNSCLTIIDAIFSGFGDAVLLLGGVFYGEKDPDEGKTLLKTSLSSGVAVFFLISITTFAASVPIAKLFSDTNDAAFIAEASKAIKLTSLYFVPNIIACILKKYIQAVGRARYTAIANILCNAVYMCSAAFIMVNIIDSSGIFLSNLIGILMILSTHLLYAYILAQKSGRKGFDMLLYLPANYEVADDDIWKSSINNISDCIEASKAILSQCGKRDIDSKRAYRISLFIEEMTSNIVQHGFRNGSSNKIMLKVLFLKDRIVLNIKDNCPRFDPKYYYNSISENEDKTKGIGIRIVMKLAKKVSYTNTFNLNNLMIEI
ncbi:MAG: ATP-binding protein [Spirochaetales bacterium]|nr:ATP-binding protein [Spirochaetales bacterium]